MLNTYRGKRVFRQRRGLQRRLGWALLSASVGGIALSLLPSFSALAVPLAIFAGVISYLSVLWLWSIDREPDKRKGVRGELRLEADVLAVETGGKTARYPLANLQDGWLEEVDSLVGAVLRFKGDHLVVIRKPAKQREQVEALLRRVGADARAVRFRLPRSPRNERLLLGFFTLPLMLLSSWAVMATLYFIVIELLQGYSRAPGAPCVSAAMLPIAAYTTYLIVRDVRVAHVTVGSDGLLVERTYYRRRFIPYGQLRQVRSQDRTIQLLLGSSPEPKARGKRRSKAVISIHCAGSAVAQAVADRIDEALQSWHDGHDSVDLAVIERGSRSYEAWRDELTELLDRPGRYRQTSFDEEELLRVLEDPAASPEQRVGAALVMGRRQAGSTRKRLRIATESCASPALRRALAQAVEGEIEQAAIEEAQRMFDGATVEAEHR